MQKISIENNAEIFAFKIPYEFRILRERIRQYKEKSDKNKYISLSSIELDIDYYFRNNFITNYERNKLLYHLNSAK